MSLPYKYKGVDPIAAKDISFAVFGGCYLLKDSNQEIASPNNPLLIWITITTVF